MGERERKRITEQLSLLRDALRTDTFRRMRRNGGPYDPPKIAPDGTWVWWNIMVPIKTYKRGGRASVLNCVVREDDVVLEGRRFNGALLPAFSEGGEDTKPVRMEPSREPEFNAALLPRYITRA